MDRKRGRDAPSKGSSSESSSNSPASPASPALDSGKPVGGANAFANDGSFMEMFKKKMEEERRKKEAEQAICPESTATAAADEGQSTVEKKTSSVASFVGKRRGGAKLTLRTGMVAKKQKVDDELESGKGDAWTKYMAEVKKYKAHQCGDDDKTRPLVK
ncbi:telomerase RNA component interacting RNase [Engraulis encrasicolus]|uniref:telomerase RNA component interacting RNase n=1 Tax=Engraulis encrasicolus TaxID=184585 RepID=UPI002FD3F170